MEGAKAGGIKQLSSPLQVQLEGYEFMDLLSAKHGIHQRRINLKGNGTAWIDLISQIHAVTLFGNNFGEVYRPTREIEGTICSDWRTVPRGHEYLALPVSLLDDIKTQSWREGVVDRESPEIAPGQFWIPTEDAFKSCEPSCKHSSPKRVQNLRQSKCKSAKGKEPTGLPPKNGAVLFGNSSALETDRLTVSGPFLGRPKMDSVHSGGFDPNALSLFQAASEGASSSGTNRSQEVAHMATGTAPGPALPLDIHSGSHIVPSPASRDGAADQSLKHIVLETPANSSSTPGSAATKTTLKKQSSRSKRWKWLLKWAS